jgi:hypothetical protein
VKVSAESAPEEKPSPGRPRTWAGHVAALGVGGIAVFAFERLVFGPELGSGLKAVLSLLAGGVVFAAAEYLILLGGALLTDFLIRREERPVSVSITPKRTRRRRRLGWGARPSA